MVQNVDLLLRQGTPLFHKPTLILKAIYSQLFCVNLERRRHPETTGCDQFLIASLKIREN
jgi:hypothetical protein